MPSENGSRNDSQISKNGTVKALGKDFGGLIDNQGTMLSSLQLSIKIKIKYICALKELYASIN